MNNEEKIEFDITKLVLATYNKIAMWRNTDYDSPKQEGDALKLVSQDIVQNTLEEIMAGLNVKTNTEVFRGNAKVGDSQIIRDEASFTKANESDILNKLLGK